ncbi:Fumarylacetoacetase [Daldinia decipiens]|uniref:Fumarylacetoacetase n=1 Tax=Daldinia decipiens TaxID=326647 RepID=UPI0020C1C5E5|nr:Fumarylacetoacetase [Daldinia decipiens]KAI1656438.1 Fumarylacetoacetase [Daldinia decipiens]
MASTWVPGVSPDSPFSLANIPFGIISSPANPAPHVAIAIGSHVLDLKVLSSYPDFDDLFPTLKNYPGIFSNSTLNEFAALGRPVHRDVRRTIQDLLSAETSRPEILKDNLGLRQDAVLPQHKVKMHLPMSIGDYTDFYAGFHHAYYVGALFRGPQAALQPNYTHLPVGYHGRASSIVVSGTPIKRPFGQIITDPTAEPKHPTTAPSRRLDIELELGCFISIPNEMGSPIKVTNAEDHIFGYVLLNDWSARDIQTWEYVPLGPFNGKNFATTISPWVVLADALEPFRTNPIDNWTPLQGYLNEGKEKNIFGIELQVDLETPQGDSTRICTTSSKYLMWSFPQMIAHHTLGGCPLRTGDLLGSGTISGPSLGERGSFLELSEGGRKDIMLQGMDVRRFLKDGDIITIQGVCGEQGRKVGFGECTGQIIGATPQL